MATLEDEYLRRNTLARREGLAEGAAEMQTRLNKLNTLLLNAGRLDDLKKSLDDTEYQQSLFEEFNI